MSYNWLDIQNKNEIGEINIYGQISDEKWYDEDVTPIEIKNKIKTFEKVDEINMYINSPGGGVFAGLAIYNMLNRFKDKITAYVDGMAASIASVLLMVADRRISPENATIMIHNPYGMAVGDADEMRKTARLLDSAKKSIMGVYKSRTALTDNKLSKMMDNETWMFGQEAYDLGFVDEIEANKSIEACIRDDYALINGLKVDIKAFKCFPKGELNTTNINKEAVKALENDLNKFKNKFSVL